MKFQLSKSEKRELKNLAKKNKSAKLFKRTQALLLLSEGKSVRDVAKTLSVSRQAVYNWKERYETSNRDPKSLLSKPIPGRPRIHSEKELKKIKTEFNKNPKKLGYVTEFWTVRLLIEHLKKKCGIIISDKTLRRRLHEFGYVWRHPRYVYEAGQ